MTTGTPVTLADFRAAIIERTQMQATDPRAANAFLDPLINEAMHRFQIANPHGWPWDYAEVSFALTIGVDTLTPGMNGTTPGTLTKIRTCVLRHPTGLWEYPLERVTRSDQLDRYPLDTETGAPRTYCELGDAAALTGEPSLQVKLRPTPDLAYTLIIGGAFPADDLVNGTDPDPAVNDYMIADWSESVLNYASTLVYRSHADLIEAAVAPAQAFKASVLQLRRTARLRVGPGIGTNPIIDDLNIT